MTRKVKIGIYYVVMFLIMCTLIFLIELKSDRDVNSSYEKSTYEGYEKYVSVPRNLEVLGRGESTTFFGVIGDTITDQLLMVLFLIISTIPLVIYYSAKYIEKLDNETNELINISNNEYLQTKENSKENISVNHKAMFTDGYFSYKQGMFAGMLSDHLKMRDVFVGINDERSNAIVFEQDIKNENFIGKILKGFSYGGEGIVVIDQNNQVYNSTSESMNEYGYDIEKIDFTIQNSEKNIFNKSKGVLKIDLLKYFNSESEIMSLASIIAQGNTYLTKMIASLIFTVMNDASFETPSLKDVYNLACEPLEKVVMKINLYKNAYNTYNELILLDQKTKSLILGEAKENLEVFNNEIFDIENMEKRDEIVDLEEIRTRAIIYYINLDELKAPYPISNVIMEAIFNICKQSYIKEGKTPQRKVYVLNPSLNIYSKYGHLSDRLKDAKKYGMFYALGLTNVKQFKDKYEYEFDKVLDYSDIKIFYAIRQYETTETLKNELSMHGANDIANIIGSMDTNKCLVLSKNYDYTVLNIDEPSGETYDKYSYGQKESESVIEKIKNKDIKLKINYLDEFKERVNKKQETVKPKVEEKTLNLQPELTKEEKEYIANLLKEKQEQDERKLAFRNNDFVYEEDDEFADGDVDNDKTLVRSLTNMYDKEDYITEGYESDYDKDKEEAARRYKVTTDKQTALRSKEEIDASLEKLNLIQNNYAKVVEEEKMKTTHALYEQMKNLK